MSKFHSLGSRSYSWLLPATTLLGMATVALGSTPVIAQERPPVEAQPIERRTSGVSSYITTYPGYIAPVYYGSPAYSSEGISFSVSTPVVTSYPASYPRGYSVRYPVGYPSGYSSGYGRSINNAVIVNPTIINSQIRNSTLVNPTIVSPQRPAVYRAAPYYGSGRSVIRYPAIEVYPSVYGY